MNEREGLVYCISQMEMLHLKLHHLYLQLEPEEQKMAFPNGFLTFQNHFDELLQFNLASISSQFGHFNLEERFLLAGIANMSVDLTADLNRHLVKRNFPIEIHWTAQPKILNDKLEQIKEAIQEPVAALREEVQKGIDSLPFSQKDFSDYAEGILLISDKLMALSNDRNEENCNIAADAMRQEFINPLFSGNRFILAIC